MKKIHVKFRSCLFGGFRRKDVVECIGKLALEKETLEKEILQLNNKISALEEQAAAAPIVESEDAEKDDFAAETAAKALAEDSAKTSSEEEIMQLQKKYAEIKADVDVSVTHMKCELSRMEEQFSSLMQCMEKTGERIHSLNNQ